MEHSDHQGQHRPDVAVGAGDDDHVSFIPLQLTSSTQLSVRPLSSPAPLTSPPAMSITVKRLSPSPEQVRQTRLLVLPTMTTVMVVMKKSSNGFFSRLSHWRPL